MPARKKRAVLTKHALLTRGGRILSLIPTENAISDDGNASDVDDELLGAPVSHSDSSSPALSIASSLERLNILDSDDETSTDENVRLTPIFQEVYPNPSLEPDCSTIPIISDIPTLPATPATPATPASPATLNPVSQVASASQASPAQPSVSIPSTPTTSSTLPNRLTRKRRSKKPTVPVAKRSRRIKKFILCYKWKRAAVFRHKATVEDVPEIDSQTPTIPLDYFYKFFSPDVITDIVEQTNAYSMEKTGRSIELVEDELRDFLAIHIMMGVVSMPSYTDYWSLQYRFGLVADLMPIKRYQKIRRYLHFVDNSTDNSDRYHKIRPIVEKIRANCLAQEVETKFSIDEMMIPYKGTKAGKRRQYMKDKPNKWGFKNFVRAGVSGMIYDFILYGGEDTFRFHNFTEEELSLGFGAQVVIALCRSIKKIPAFIFCDNFFSCPELFYILRENYGIFALGTIRKNRLRGADAVLRTEKEMKKKPRGAYDQVVCDKNRLTVVRWNDNKVVTLVSTYVGTEPVEKIKRYCKEAKQKVEVNCPQVVKEYNKHMGGVDLADMLISLYRTPFKTRRWYIGIFAQLLDICINNAWLSYRNDCTKIKKKAMPLKAFRYEIYEGLKKNRRAVIDPLDIKKRPQKAIQPVPVESSRFDN
ncbi:piggyBac transposable element-derived protein 2-like, partial [Hyposmocoma kahamanoa]|uniref:piggyBac transposable element-derived protein 2-like n=1 Tax=Hyposmocoma kahamanoa TaxID=1477025 RepID=UPI000E6D898E